jgi:hypothetical protein
MATSCGKEKFIILHPYEADVPLLKRAECPGVDPLSAINITLQLKGGNHKEGKKFTRRLYRFQLGSERERCELETVCMFSTFEVA